MERLYTYKFRLDPTEVQKVLLNRHFGSCRYIYNTFLWERIQNYKTNKTIGSTNVTDLPNLKKKLPWLKDINAQSLQYTVECLDDAYKGFWGKSSKGKKLKKKKGFPKFKKKVENQSFRVKQCIKIENDKLIIPKFLEGISIILHRQIEGEIRFATVTKNKIGQFYVSITVKRDIQPLPKSDKAIGIDLNVLENVDSNDHKEPNPLPGKIYEKKLRSAHQRLSRRENKVKDKKVNKTHSKGCEKARKQLAKVYLKVHNKREYHLHKYSKQIINENQVICCENLCIESMLAKVAPDKRTMSRWKEKKLHKDIQDCGWRSLLVKFKYKSELYGREFIQVDRWFPSSQICHHCGFRYYDLPKDCKEWLCMGCCKLNDRNFNSSKNILYEGIRIRTSGTEGIAESLDVRPAYSRPLTVSETAAER